MVETDFIETNKRLIEDLRRIPTFQPFDEDDLLNLLRLSKFRKFNVGETIIREGSFEPYIYFLICGRLHISKNGKEIAVLSHRGEIFGEMSLLGETGRTATVMAAADSICLAADTSKIQKLAGSSKSAFSYVLYRIFAETLAERLKTANEVLSQKKGGNWKFWQQ